jgi:hypothetical protein
LADSGICPSVFSEMRFDRVLSLCSMQRVHRKIA